MHYKTHFGAKIEIFYLKFGHCLANNFFNIKFYFTKIIQNIILILNFIFLTLDLCLHFKCLHRFRNGSNVIFLSI